MVIRKSILLALMLYLFFNEASAFGKYFPEKTSTFIEGKLFFSIKEKHLKAKLAYSYLAKDSTRTSLSFFLTPDVKIDTIAGSNVKNYAFDAQAKPFSTLKIYFKSPLAKGKPMNFSIAYSGKPTKGFWSEEHNWIDIDPDFMILPIFSTLENFTYQLYASVDDKKFTFYDLEKAQITDNLHLTSSKPSYYFNPILAGNNAANGMKIYNARRKIYNINIFTNKPDSANYIADAAGKILNLFNTTFGKKDTINSLTVLYRPLPYSVHPVTRSFNRAIVFARNDKDIGTLAHEIAHFWWGRGDALTTEKWLSESFAEYSKFMFIRHEQGEEKFKEIITQLAAQTEKLPSLLGKDRFSPEGNNLIYKKGPYLLYQLENKIGREKFIALLVELNYKKIATTKDMLLVVEQITSAPVRKEFEESLNK